MATDPEASEELSEANLILSNLNPLIMNKF